MIAMAVVDLTAEVLRDVALLVGFTVIVVGALGGLFTALSVVFAAAVSDVGEDLTTSPRELVDDTSVDGVVFDRDDPDLDFEPRPHLRLDWSVGPAVSESDVRDAMAALDLAGLYAHPLPQSPRAPFRESWQWSSRVVGVWTEEPTLYLETDAGREAVEADLSTWEIEAEKELIGSVGWDGDDR